MFWQQIMCINIIIQHYWSLLQLLRLLAFIIIICQWHKVLSLFKLMFIIASYCNLLNVWQHNNHNNCNNCNNIICTHALLWSMSGCMRMIYYLRHIHMHAFPLFHSRNMHRCNVGALPFGWHLPCTCVKHLVSTRPVPQPVNPWTSYWAGTVSDPSTAGRTN